LNRNLHKKNLQNMKEKQKKGKVKFNHKKSN